MADNNILGLVVFSKSAGSFLKKMKIKPADFTNPKRFATFLTVILNFHFS
jgi:hypothetical protein